MFSRTVGKCLFGALSLMLTFGLLTAELSAQVPPPAPGGGSGGSSSYSIDVYGYGNHTTTADTADAAAMAAAKQAAIDTAVAEADQDVADKSSDTINNLPDGHHCVAVIQSTTEYTVTSSQVGNQITYVAHAVAHDLLIIEVEDDDDGGGGGGGPIDPIEEEIDP